MSNGGLFTPTGASALTNAWIGGAQPAGQLQSGLNQFMFGNIATGGAGMFGVGGSFNLPQTMMTAGMGLGLAQAFSAQGSSYLQKHVPLSKGGKKLKTSLYENAKARLSGQNLAEPYVRTYKSISKGKVKREAQGTTNSLRGIGGALGTKTVRTGRDAGALIASAGQQVEGGAAPDIWGEEFDRGEWTKGIADIQNLINTERQLGLYKSGVGMTADTIGRMEGAGKGKALGDVARYIAYMRYPPYSIYS